MRIRILVFLVQVALWEGLKAQTGPQLEVLTPDVCVPGQVSLRVINCSSCTTYEWEIGAGKGYKTAGSNYSTILASTDTGWFDVSVRITTSSGGQILLNTKKAFYGRGAPKVNFTLSQSTFCKGTDTVLLQDVTPNSVSRDWLVEGKVFYNGPPVLKYGLSQAYGYRSVYLLVRDSWNCKGKLLRDSAISVWDSVKANIVATVSGKCAPTTVNYMVYVDSGQQTPTAFMWKFQGGSPAVNWFRNPKGVYYATGDTFDTDLTIYTNRSCQYKYHFNNVINLGDTSLLKIAVSKARICANEPLQLSVTGNKNPNVVWNVTGVITNEGTQVGTTVTYSFRDTGNPIITATESNKGCVSTATFGTKITIEGPVAGVVSESPFYCGVPKNLVFSNTSMEWQGGTSWQWKLTDPLGNLISSATTKGFSYTANSGINYTVFLKATGANGCSDSVLLKNASAFGHIDTNFTVNPNPVCVDKKVTLVPVAGQGSSSDPNKYLWTFYDENGNVAFTDNKVNSSYSYSKNGSYSAKMVVSNNSNCKDSVKLTDTIHVTSPIINIIMDDTFACRGAAIRAYGKYNYKSPTGYLFWEFVNIDSGTTLFRGGDSPVFYASSNGRHTLKVTMLDTAKEACSFSTKLPGYIWVSGIQVLATPDSSFGCVPLVVNAGSNLLHNVSYRVKDPAVKYDWKTSSPSGLSFSSTNTANTTITASTEAKHYGYVVVENQSGCKDSSYALIDSRFQAGFYLENSAHCVGHKGKVINTATTWATNYLYQADPSVIFIPGANVPDPEIRFTKPGTWPVTQIIWDGSCRDTMIGYFTITEIKADFYTPDSVVYCAPRLISFVNTSSTPVYNYWKFGDGDSVISLFNDLTGHLYQKNNPNPGFDITLIAENNYGCRDTMTKKAYLRIIGPVPDFTTENNYGCEPLVVTFKNKSTDYSRMLLDYDDGVVLDSMELGSHKYYVTNKALPIQEFFPKLLLVDSLGCSALSEIKDTVTVLKGPEPKFTFTSVNFLRNTEGCANQLLVKFTNQSKFFSRTYWDFNGDYKIDIQNQNSPSYLYDKAGVFYPRLIAQHLNGCTDSFVQDSIIVWDPPVADFITASDTNCAVDPVKFIYTGKSAHPVVKYNWNFGELPIFNDTAHFASPTWTYTTPFNHNVTLEVEDSKGCKDQVVKNQYVNDTAGPVKPELAYITVRDDKYVDFYWRQSPLSNFFQYHVLLDSLGLWPKMTSYNRSDTFYSANYGAQTANRRFCFTVQTEDTCSQEGYVALSHCSIVLRDTAIDPFHIRLTWLGYDWWGNDLDHYEIFRKETGNNNYTKLADVKTNKLSYIDSFLCDKNYCYYVEAVHKNKVYRSRSNSACGKPIYFKPDRTVKTTLVTVETNAYTKVSWEPYYKYYRDWSYVLERSSSGLPGSFSTVAEVTGVSATDFNANVHDRVNHYRIKFKDHCGSASVPGTVSNSILLKVNTESKNSSKLNWNAYSYWYSGVRQYTVQLKDASGNFSDMSTYGGNTFESSSFDIEKLQLDSVCFRVYAVKDTTVGDTSWSNELCMVPSSYLHVPTAFTPNKNNLNEVFKPVSGFIRKDIDRPETRYEFMVYNRWGQLVFYTNDPAAGWDGTYQGEMSGNGLFIWKIQAVGYDGVPHRQEGTVYLLR